MQTIKLIHITCAYITGLGFLIRGVIVIMQHPLRHHRLTKILPHFIDTCLFLSGLFMVFSWAISPLEQSWLLIKLIVLLFYIGFGLLMLRWGTTVQKRWFGLVGGVLMYLYIIGAAHSKSALSYFSIFY